MTSKIFAVVCMLGLVVLSNLAWSAAKWSRGDCINAANEKYGKVDQAHQEMRAAVHRCLKNGPGAV
jgi:hypothetical protein